MGAGFAIVYGVRNSRQRMGFRVFAGIQLTKHNVMRMRSARLVAGVFGSAMAVLIGTQLGKAFGISIDPSVVIPSSEPAASRPSVVRAQQPPAAPTNHARSFFDDARATKVVIPDAALDDTQLKLELNALAKHDQPERSMAIIAAADAPPKTYRWGDRVPGGAVIQEIRKDRLILRHRGRMEQLRLRRDSLTIQSTPSETIATPPALSPAEIIAQLAPQPVSLASGGMGVRVNPSPEADWAEQAGLKSGDILIAIDSQDLTDPQRLAEQLQNLGPNDSLSVALIRDERRLEIRLDMESQ